MPATDPVYARIQSYNKNKIFTVKAAHDSSADLVNNLSSISGQCNNLVDTISEYESAKQSKNGDAMDAALDKLKGQLKDFTSVSKIVKQTFLSYLKPLIKDV